MSDQDRMDILGNLYSIVNDLWGASQPPKPGTAPEKPEAGAQPVNKPAAGVRPMNVRPLSAAGPLPVAKPAPAPSPSTDEKSVKEPPKAPDLKEYWRTADEPLPWTEALIQPQCRDGLTSEEIWAFCHEQAEAVLSGDTAAYGRVLEKVQPLSDLAPYTSRLQVKIDSADSLQADFALTPELNQREPTTHLCCAAIRIARDLMAALPVTEVRLAGQAGPLRLTATLSRAALKNVHWGFVDAETLLIALGAVIRSE